MKKLTYLAMAAIATLFFSCQPSAEGCIKEMKALVEEINESTEEFTEEKWEELNDTFTQLVEEAGKLEEMTDEQKLELAKLQGQYAAAVMKKGGKTLMKDLNEGIEQAGKVLEGALEELKK